MTENPNFLPEGEEVPGGLDQDGDIRAKVEARILAEQAATGPGVRDAEGELSSEFVRQCFWANELGDGILYNTLHRDRFVFCKSIGAWLVWQGHHWAVDEMDEAAAAVENVVVEYRKEGQRIDNTLAELHGKEDAVDKIRRLSDFKKDLTRRIWALRSIRRRNNCLTAAYTCDNPLSIHGRELDQQPWLLPCRNGVVDLRTGSLMAGNPRDYMLLACPTEYQGIDAPRVTWERALMEILEGDDLVVEYLQRLLGMATIGAVYEHVFPVLTGPGGRNGKSTIVEAISYVLGPLARPIRSEMLMDTYQMQSSTGPTPDIMSLRGLRFAWASETKEGAKISAARVKLLTGGDRLTGRNPHDKFETTFSPTHTLFLLSNFKPAADANDKAFWERTQNIPFNVRFLKNREPVESNERKADIYLKDKLMAEAPGILGWLVEGCLKWQREELKPPPKVVQETLDYMEDEDNYSAFIEHCLERGEWLTIGATELYDAFEAWWKRYVGRWVPKQKKFGKQMREIFECKKTGGIYVYFGIDLNEQWRAAMNGGQGALGPP